MEKKSKEKKAVPVDPVTPPAAAQAPPPDFATIAAALLEIEVLAGAGKLDPDSREAWAARLGELQRMVEFCDARSRESDERAEQLQRAVRDERIALEKAHLHGAELQEEADAAAEERRRLGNELSAVENQVSTSQADGNELTMREKEAIEDVQQVQNDNAQLVGPALAALAAGVAGLREELSMADSQIASVSESRAEMRRKMERINGDSRTLRTMLDTLRVEEAKQAGEPERLAKQAEGVEVMIYAVRAELDKVQAAVEGRARDLEAQKSAISDVAAFRADLEKKTARHRADLESREQEVSALERTQRGERSNHKGLLERKVETQAMESGARASARSAQEALAEANAAYERAKRELKIKLDRINEVKDVVAIAESQLNEREIELHSQGEDARRIAARSGALRHEMEGLLAAYLKEESVEKRHRTALSEVAESCAALEAEKEAWAAEEALAIKQIAALKVQRDAKARELEATQAARKAETEKSRMKEIVLGDLSKQLADTAAKLKQFSSLYDVAKKERNSYASAIQSSQQATAEMRERLKILRNEVDILLSESAAKDKALAKEHQALTAASSQRDGLRAAVNRSALNYSARQLTVEQQILRIDKLSSIIDGLERDMNALKLQYEAAVEMRSFTGIQLIDRNDELCVLYEKSNVHEKTAAQGESALLELQDEVRSLAIALKELERQQYIARQKLPDTPMWAERILEMQNALVAARQVSERLCTQLETPATAQRWIALDGDDPDTEQLQLRAAELEQSLGLLKQELLDRELSLEELRGLSERVISVLHGSPDLAGGTSGPAAAALGKQLNDLQSKVREATRRLMALVSEVSMYQAEGLKLQQESAAAAQRLAAAQEALDKGLPPSLAAEQRVSLLERQQQLLLQQQQRAAAGDEPLAGPEPRPNMYLTDSGAGLPRPFGKFAPFKPSEAGASMRHFHLPVQKPIDL